MGMFCGLGSGVLVRELDHVQLSFEDTVEWAMEHLHKDDRIIWFLGIVQRGALLRMRNSGGRRIRPKLRLKIERKLKGFDDNRVLADLESDFTMNWPHYQNLADMYQATLLKNYSFHFRKGKRLSPKSVGEILRDYEGMEERLQELAGGERFCTDGKPYLELENEWTWFAVEEGQSYQEAQAMRHCGNGGGRPGDVLLSLREPVRKGDLLFWKPHLTFILNNGVLGEMKGYANARPLKQLHPQVTGLLSRPEIREVQGGGYLPQNNFAFCDMNITQQEQSLQANPDLVVDPFGDDGEVQYATLPGFDELSGFGVKPNPVYDTAEPMVVQAASGEMVYATADDGTTFEAPVQRDHYSSMNKGWKKTVAVDQDNSSA